MANAVDFTPCITSHPPDSEVHCRLRLVEGTCGSSSITTNGDIQIIADRNNFPTQTFPVRNGRFKILIHLSSGENRIQLSFSDDQHRRYLWQTYTASQMFSNGFGHRTFRLDESYQRDTLSGEDQSQRETVMIHVLKSKYTTAQIRHPSRAQQNLNDKNKNILFDIALEAIRSKFQEERNYVAVLLLNSHYEDNLITDHAALGSGSIDAQYSGCWLTRNTGIDAEGDKYWIACNVGLGAMLHEIGHALGCPYEQNGILLKSTNGILAIEFYLERDKVAKSWIDYLENPPAEVILWKEELRSRVNGEGKINTPSHATGPLIEVVFHSGLALDGLEFFTKEHSVLFGKRGGSSHDFPMENGEFIQGFGVRSGVWIDAVQIVTNKKRSEWFGDIAGG
ncbi:unnamed protein product, partial [Adineta ricciae]